MGVPLHNFTYGLGDVAERLGQTHGPAPLHRPRTTRWQLAYVASLIEGHDFPTPLPLMLGTELHDDPKPGSRWPAGAVDAWIAARTPPGGEDAIDPAAVRAAANDMDDAAQNLARHFHQHRGAVA